MNSPARKSRSSLARHAQSDSRRAGRGETLRNLLARLLLLGGTLPLVCWTAAAWGQIRIQVPEPGGAGVPIAVSPLANPSGAEDERIAETFADVLARDLELSGLFRLIPRRAYIEPPDRFEIPHVNFANWTVLDALALVKGAFWLEGDRLMIEARLFDVTQKKQIGGRRYQGHRDEVRRMAHRFADKVMLYLTGEEGPFNSSIAFVSNRAGGRFKDIYVSDVSGSEVQRVTRDRTLNLGPSWSPTGEDLLFISYKRGGPHPMTLNLSSGRRTRVSARVAYTGSWSPDGQHVVVSLERDGNSDLFLLTPRGGLVRRLTNHTGIDVSPAWSPDGSRLAFCSSRSGSPQIHVMDVASGKTTRITSKGDYNTDPSWSPKGDRIAYTARAGGFRVKWIPPEGGAATEITSGEDPSWSPDGRYLAFTRRGRIFMVSREGHGRKQLTSGNGNDSSPAWSPRRS